MRGWFVQQRHYLARFAARYPRTTVVGIDLRKWWWWLVGWPFTVSAMWLIRLIMVAGLFVWLVPSGAATGFGRWVADVVAWWPSGRDGVITVGLLLGAVGAAKWWWVSHVETDWFGLVKTLWRYAGRSMMIANAALVLNPLLVAVALFGFWVGLAVDLVTGLTSRRTALMRRYAEFRRELPDHWTDLAARSKRVQSIDVGLERTVSEAANERPILEHPGLGGLLDTRFNDAEFLVQIPVSRLEGRSLEALEEVIDELAAQYFSVSDDIESIKIVSNQPVRSNFASWAWLEIRFNPPTNRLPWNRVRDAIGGLLFGANPQVAT